MGKNINLSDKEIDDLLATVERTLEQAPSLSKSLKKDDAPGEEKPEEKPAAEAAPTDAPAAEAPAPEAPPAEAAAPAAAEGAAPAAEGEGQLQGEAEDAPLSDEELQQIYGSMPPEELERHYMAIRQFLEQHMGGAEAGGEAPAAAAGGGAPAPAPEQPAMKSEDKSQGQPVAKAEQKPAAESEEVKALKSEVQKLQKVAETAVKAVELVLQPSRKAVTGIEFIRKNDEMEGKGAQGSEEDTSKLTKSDIDAKLKKIGPAALSKAEREAVNNFLLTNTGKDKVLDIIKSKGGK